MSTRRLMVAVGGLAVVVGLVLWWQGHWAAEEHAVDRKDLTGVARERVAFRLQWYPQAQFAGYLFARARGLYGREGLDVDIRSGGPDLRPQTTVASGTDDIAVGISNQVIVARSNEVPLKIIAQMFQDSANLYVLKKEFGIGDISELRGQKVGLWTGGDEAEFVAMLATRKLKLEDVRVIPQGFSVSPFLQDQYRLSQVTAYNEYLQIKRAGWGPDKLQVLRPVDYGAAIVGDMLFTSEDMLRRRPDVVTHFLAASLDGWRMCAEDRSGCLDAVLAANSSLDRSEQAEQLEVVLDLILAGAGAGAVAGTGIGAMDAAAYATGIRVLAMSGQLGGPVDALTVFDPGPWSRVPANRKVLIGKRRIN